MLRTAPTRPTSSIRGCMDTGSHLPFLLPHQILPMPTAPTKPARIPPRRRAQCGGRGGGQERPCRTRPSTAQHSAAALNTGLKATHIPAQGSPMRGPAAPPTGPQLSWSTGRQPGGHSPTGAAHSCCLHRAEAADGQMAALSSGPQHCRFGTAGGVGRNPTCFPSAELTAIWDPLLAAKAS